MARNFCYPIIAGNALVFHHTPGIGVLLDAAWCVLEYAAPDHSRGYCGVFSLNQHELSGPAVEYVVRLRGIDYARQYEITLDNSGQSFSVSGHELANVGLTVRIVGSMSSELILYQAIN